MPLDGLCLEFFGDFSDFFEGGLWGKLLIGNIQYFGAQMFPVVWPAVICVAFLCVCALSFHSLRFKVLG